MVQCVLLPFNFRFVYTVLLLQVSFKVASFPGSVDSQFTLGRLVEVLDVLVVRWPLLPRMLKTKHCTVHCI